MRAFVLSGGASLGAIQVGMLQALDEAGVRPDLIVGTSVGAMNGAWLAGHPDDPIDELAAIWRGLRRHDVFPAEPLHGLFGFLGRRRGLVPAGPLHRLIERHIDLDRIEDAPVALHIIATDVLTTADIRLSRGPAALSVLASASIPGVLPPVEIDGRFFMDGGVVNNTPISHAVDLGADEIWVLPTGYSCALREPPRSALGMALHGLNALVHQRLVADIEHSADHGVDLRVVPPPCPVRTSPADFSDAAALIARSYAGASAWLDAGAPRVALGRLRPHDHPPDPTGVLAEADAR